MRSLVLQQNRRCVYKKPSYTAHHVLSSLQVAHPVKNVDKLVVAVANHLLLDLLRFAGRFLERLEGQESLVTFAGGAEYCEMSSRSFFEGGLSYLNWPRKLWACSTGCVGS